MTLLAGANLGGYTLIAADTRASWQDPPGTWHHLDREAKIARCGFGLVTGSGYEGALNAVKKELLRRSIEHTDDFLEVVRYHAMPVLEQLRENFPAVDDRTFFLQSYLTDVDGRAVLRLAAIKPGRDMGIAPYNDDAVVLTGPPDISVEEISEYKRYLRESIRRFEWPDDFLLQNEDDRDKLSQSIVQNSRSIIEVFDAVRQNSRYVSEDIVPIPPTSNTHSVFVRTVSRLSFPGALNLKECSTSCQS